MRGTRHGCDRSPRKGLRRRQTGETLGRRTPGVYNSWERLHEDQEGGHGLQETSRDLPNSPHPKLSPEEAACVLIEGDRSICMFSEEGSLHQTWLLLEVFLPIPGRVGGVRKGRVDRKGFRQTNTGPGSRTKKDAVTTLVTKGTFWKILFPGGILSLGPWNAPEQF